MWILKDSIGMTTALASNGPLGHLVVTLGVTGSNDETHWCSVYTINRPDRRTELIQGEFRSDTDRFLSSDEVVFSLLYQ